MKYLTSFSLCFMITFIGSAIIVKTTGPIDGFVLVILLVQSFLAGLVSALLSWVYEE